MHCLLHKPYFCLHFYLIPALLYYFCLMDPFTVCTYVYHVILELSLIPLCEYSVVDKMEFS